MKSTQNNAAVPAGAILLSDSFEGGNLKAWARRSVNGNGTITIVNQPVLTGQRAVQFSVPNDGQSYRAELATKPTAWGTYRYQFAVYLPMDWQQTHLGTIVAQWHGTKLANGQNTNPPISLAVQDNHWRFLIHRLASPTRVTKKEFELPTIEPGVWNQFDVRITWSTPSSPGMVTLYRNGQLWAKYAGINNYHQKNPPYFKIGIYRPLWNPRKEAKYSTGGPPVVVDHDEVTVTKYDGPM